ncbi:bifunctional diguanylate cyclase/phosphodiesterase [Methylobacter sp. S3L5C]|uniref:putative bifunctional diguanylate cyclase/phosphodiesterase n=1 Tax=Methylobacter sp. S3L5C TaxID=2839024 RepID=UPI001FAD7FC5|nr:EAL domain-containing protein [Methylobacter sp. S3L5C]UOA10566.1 EAL domain-containing protein [Methylobacter sp. S3L5C]
MFRSISGVFGKLFLFGPHNSWRRLMLGAASLSLLILLAIWLYILQSIENQERLVIENTKSFQHNLSATVSENLNQLLDRGKLFCAFSSQLLENQQNTLTQTRITAMLGTDQAFNRIEIYDLHGQKIFSSAPSLPDATLNTVIQQRLALDMQNVKPGMVFGPIPKTLSDAWQIPLLYLVKDSREENTGVLLLVLDLGYLLRLNQNLAMGMTEIINIVTDDSQEIARASIAGLEFGGSALITSNITTANSTNPFVDFKPLFQDQVSRIITYQHSDRHPFSIIVSQEINEMLKSFREKKREALLLVFFLTMVVIISMILIAFAIQRKQRAFMALVTSEIDKNELILKLHDEKQKAFDLAETDYLTGLYTRNKFTELASRYLIHAKRNRLHYAVLFIDLDRFKAINDSLGHHVGDLLLQTVADRLQSTLRKTDVIARFGGDEFVILLTGLQNEKDITGVAKKIVETVSQPCLDLANHDLQIYPSVGIAIFPRDGNEIIALMKNADLAMYQSKHSKNRSYTFFDASLNTENILEFTLDQHFSTAIKNGEFVLHFQPKIDLSSYRIVGLEALVRWQHPEHGLIFPNTFIPLAENTGHIIELGNWVIEASCRQISAWKSAGIPIVPVAINVSGQQLKSDTLAKYLTQCLEQYGLESKYLQIELTESSLVENIETAKAILNHIADSGIHIALDDFGTGFSSLGYIKNLPIHTIKIDRSFISNIRNSHDDAVIVTSTIALAHNLGMRVVAEGVETSEQLVYLRASGCDEVQGYFFSRPVPDNAIRQLLIKEKLCP